MAVKTGLQRVAQALRWLALGWLALWVALGLAGALGDFGNTMIVLLMFAVIPSAIAWLLGWIVDGFANKEG